VEHLSEALPATSIVAGTDGPKSAAGKIIILDGAPAGRTGVGHVDEWIAASVAAVRVGAGWKEQGRQHEQHQSSYHVIFLPG
jgi:hypothetical protein